MRELSLSQRASMESAGAKERAQEGDTDDFVVEIMRIDDCSPVCEPFPLDRTRHERREEGGQPIEQQLHPSAPEQSKRKNETAFPLAVLRVNSPSKWPGVIEQRQNPPRPNRAHTRRSSLSRATRRKKSWSTLNPFDISCCKRFFRGGSCRRRRRTSC